MASEFAAYNHHIRALSLAKKCAELGARVRTIGLVTGIDEEEVKRLLFQDSRSPPRGNKHNSTEWYHGANTIEQAEASIFIGIYQGMRALGVGYAEALVSGYEEFLLLRRDPEVKKRISFDRAFDLVCRTEAIWTIGTPELTVCGCSCCSHRYLAAPGDRTLRCPFCRLQERYSIDRRIQRCFPSRVISDLIDIGHEAPAGECVRAPQKDRRTISGYFPANVWETLHTLAKCLGKTRQALLEEALMYAFGKYWDRLQDGIAPVSSPTVDRPFPPKRRRGVQQDRRGKRVIAGRVQVSLWQTFSILCRILGKTCQETLEEALACLFENYRQTIAAAKPRQVPPHSVRHRPRRRSPSKSVPG